MNKDELQKLRDLPIEGVAERLGLRVSHHKSLCPFHADKNPSLSFFVKKNSYRCFVCGASGGTIDLVMHHLHLDFPDACRWLADKNNIILDEYKSKKVVEVEKPFDAQRYEPFFKYPRLTDAATQFLYGERMIDSRVVNWCHLTSWRDHEGTDWLQIPYYDTEGKLIGIQNRNLQKNASTRFRFPHGSRCSIYNLPVLNKLTDGDELYITEGCSDCWAMLSAGHKAIAIPSATLLKPTDVKLFQVLQSHDVSFHMFPDNDAPGERLFLLLRDMIPGLVRHHLAPGCKDFSEHYLLSKQTNTLE